MDSQCPPYSVVPILHFVKGVPFDVSEQRKSALFSHDHRGLGLAQSPTKEITPRLERGFHQAHQPGGVWQGSLDAHYQHSSQRDDPSCSVAP